MTEISFIPSMRPEPRRDEFGRYVLPDPAGTGTRSWTRATTIAHTLDDEYHLTQWKRRMVLAGAALRPGLLETVPELTRALTEAADDWRAAKEIKGELDALCDEAAEAAGAGEGAKLGTLLHTITEYYDADRLDEIRDLVPDQLYEDLRAYGSEMDGAELERPAEYIENIVVNTRVDSAGTFDRLLRLPDGRLVVGDLKTQKTVDFGWLSIAIQLAEYAQADAMLDPDTGELVPLPPELDRSLGIVMHLPVGKATCTLYELDLEAGWEAALAAHEVRQWRQRSKSLGRVYTPRAVAAEDRLTFLIRSAGHPEALTALWREAKGRGEWSEHHTRAAAARKAELLAAG